MRTIIKPLQQLLLLLLLLGTGTAHAEESDFSVLVIPSLMGPKLDAWFYTPREAAPYIHHASEVMQGEMFQLLVFASGYSVSEDSKVDVAYDVQVFDPEGKPTEDSGKGLEVYKGTAENPAPLILSHHFLRIIFTKKYVPGQYSIKVTAYDKIANTSITKTQTINLVPFSLPEPFNTDDEFNDWTMSYHRRPSPEKVISAIFYVDSLDDGWAENNPHMLVFFRAILRNNPYLLDAVAEHYDSLSEEEKKKLLLVMATMDESVLKPITSLLDAELKAFYEQARTFRLLPTDGEITHAQQLDILWSEFLATGDYPPIRKIISALALHRYEGTLDRIKNGELDKNDETVRLQAYREATYRSAVWSLISNSKQLDLVFQYGVYTYQNEELDDTIKQQLLAILKKAYEERQKEKNCMPGQQANANSLKCMPT